ncbi:hypothetical protein [Glaciibacter superstes]|uniref:hypothetical protein n=1 Tax=Glaciibacter superstes TaxID=501023 RepID=UPI0003FEBDCB|nr:hypothetical protein [Glaciibacter superstes]
MGGTERGARRIRLVAAGVLTLVPAAAIVVTWFLWRDGLPETLPTQWSGDSVVSTQPTWVFVALTGVTAFVSAIFGFVSSLTPVENFESRRTLLVTGLVGSLCLITWTISANLGANQAPAMLSWGVLVGGAIILAFLPAVLAPKPVPVPEISADPPLDPVERP